MANDLSDKMKKLEKLMKSKGSRELSQRVASSGFLATDQAQKIVNLVNASSPAAKQFYSELYICCQNMIKNSNVLGQAFNYYIKSSNFNAIYKDPNAAANMKKQSDGFEYLEQIDWQSYLNYSQNNQQLYQAIENLESVIDNWVQGLSALKHKLHKKS